MTKPIWKGKDEIMYRVSISDGPDEPGKHPDPDYLGAGWKYQLYMGGAGEYEEVNLGDDNYDLLLLADTKEGVIRDLAMYIAGQPPKEGLDNEMVVTGPDHPEEHIPYHESRESVGLPPLPMSPDNVEIFDDTKNNDFRNLNVPAIFSHAEALSHSPPPSGERPFIVTIRKNDKESNTYTEEYPADYYEVRVSELDPLNFQYFEDNYPIIIDYGGGIVPANEVNKIVRNELSKLKLEVEGRTFLPNTNNTKLINFTDNPEFSLEKVFAEPLQLTRMPITKTQQSHARASLPLSKKRPRMILPAKTEESEPEKETEEEKRRLRA